MILKRAARLVLVAVAFQLGGISASWAQDDDDMTFGADEATEVATDSPVADFLTEGQNLYKEGKFGEASLLFHKVLAANDVAAESFHPQAEYELGKTMFRMGLFQGALTYYGRVVDAGEAHPFYRQTLVGLALLMDAIPEDQTLLARLEPYVALFPKEVPEKYRDPFAYLVGRYLYAQGDYERALTLLNTVRPGSKYFAQARYIAGVTYVASYNAKGAVGAFKDVLRELSERRDAGNLKDEERQLLELTQLGMARVFYSTGDYNRSIKYYTQIRRRSPLWPRALFESSWAYFQMDLYNKALGNLHSINSPFFANAYFPEAPILSSVLFFYNCKYSRVRYELEEFEYAYLPLKDELAAIIEKHEDGSAMYTWLRALRSGEAAQEDEKLRRLLAASLDDKEVLRRLSLVDAIEQEEEKIKQMPSGWRSSPLGSAQLQDTTVAKELAINDAGELVKTRLERVKAEIEDFDLKRERILFEVTRAEQGELQADFRAEMLVQRNVTDEAKLEVSDEQLYWTFDGEYWRDELGAYIFNINTECKR